jgi:hypothetical protein
MRRFTAKLRPVLNDSDLLELGWHLGMSELDRAALAASFDALCSCRKAHSIHAVESQRDRSRKLLRRVLRELGEVMGTNAIDKRLELLQYISDRFIKPQHGDSNKTSV